MTVDGDNSGIVSTGPNAANIQVTLAPSTLVSTHYHRQVERIAPPHLYERESELTELATFCTAPSNGYAWWRARAWSGKSALMSWFVLHPPPGVRVVSFFVTARLASQNDRTAFVENVLEQLLALLGEAMPPHLTDSTREGHLLGRLEVAAKTCRARGEHFVLLVDGLDEDRGAHEHSIAALLPAELPAGMHVIVAGRPNPPIPDDVPPHHPLRDPAVVRPLTPSAQAQALRVEMEKDLKRLLRGTATEQDLLGLVAAAGGGLSAADLADLAGLLQWEVDDHLRTVTGRSFATRPADVVPDGPNVFLLGHEELQLTALHLLGPTRLAAYRERLHAWARLYRDRHWPGGTPEYLLRGYFRMLASTDNVPAMIACATDIHRQDRLFDLSGGDGAALTEIGTTMEVLAAQSKADLVVVTKLAIHRDYLFERNAHVPVELPDAWAALNNFARAESIAGSIVGVHHRAEALTLVAKRLIVAGQHMRAARMLGDAERTAHVVMDEHQQARALASVAAALVAAGDVDRAQAMIAALPSSHRGEATRTLVAALATAGEVNHAEVLTQSIEEPLDQAEALISVAASRAAAGEASRLSSIVATVHGLVRNKISSGDLAVRTLVSLVSALKAAGVNEHVSYLLGQAQEITRDLLDVGLWAGSAKYGQARRYLATGWAAAGDLDRAEQIAMTVTTEHERALALVAVACGHRAAGQIDRSTEVLDRAMREARLADQTERTAVLAAAARGFVELGDIDRGIRLASSITDPRMSAATLAQLALLLAAASRSEEAGYVLAHAERTAQAAAGSAGHGRGLAEAAKTLAAAGDVAHAGQAIDRAEHLTCPDADAPDVSIVQSLATPVALCGDLDRMERLSSSIVEPLTRVRVLLAVARALAEAEQVDRAAGTLDRAKQLACYIGDARYQGLALNEVSWGLAALSLYDRAGLAFRSMADINSKRSPMLTTVAEAVAATTPPDQAAAIIGHVCRTVRSIAWPTGRKRAQVGLVQIGPLSGEMNHIDDMRRATRERARREGALARIAAARAAAGDVDHAEEVVHTITDSGTRWLATALVASAAAAAGHVDRAIEIARTIGDPLDKAEALLNSARAAAEAGDFEQAERAARVITDQQRRGRALLTVLRARRSADPREVAEVLILTDWHAAIPEVVAAQPNALTDIFAELGLVYGRSNDTGASTVGDGDG